MQNSCRSFASQISSMIEHDNILLLPILPGLVRRDGATWRKDDVDSVTAY